LIESSSAFSIYKIESKNVVDVQTKGKIIYLETVSGNKLNDVIYNKYTKGKITFLIVVDNKNKWVIYKKQDDTFAVVTKGKDFTKKFKGRFEHQPELY